jgi:hypothetical protein
MPLILLDGPEKAGKSTIAKAIVNRYGGSIRQWGPVATDAVYAEALAVDCAIVKMGGTVIWDRGYASETVYARLMDRDRRLRDDAWLGEWLYGRAFVTLGLRVMVLGPSVESLMKLRDETDLPVSPSAETFEFLNHAVHYGWMTLHQTHNPSALSAVVDAIWNAATYNRDRALAAPPAWAGPNLAQTVVVGETRTAPYEGKFLPFTTAPEIEFARQMPNPFKTGWAIAGEFPPQILRSAKTIVACGNHAAQWVRYHVANRETTVIALAHPAYAFRYSTPGAQAAKRRMSKQLTALAKGDKTTDLML